MSAEILDTPSDLTAQLKVGLEIHVELATRSKMWTGAPNVAHPDYADAAPNSLIDPVVAGLPGTLPVMNRRAVEMAMQVGLALGCTINGYTKWDRKSYYYPDLPKNYQISQYDLPLCGDGALDIPIDPETDPSGNLPDTGTKRIGIVRAHLEEDAGKLLHEAPGGEPIDFSIVDLNRAGTPLLEIVTQPDFSTAAEVVSFGQRLRQICRYLGVSEAIMQKGHMRFEPNINVEIEKGGRIYKTPIVEIKNLNSFRALRGAIEYETKRQLQEWLETGRVMGERAKSTRGWDDVRELTTHQRHKEDADEYRYFPEPDLMPVVIDENWVESLRSALPEMPWVKGERYREQLGLGRKQTEALLEEPQVAAFFERCVEAGTPSSRAASMILNAGAKRANERGSLISDLGITPTQVRQIHELLQDEKIGSNAADELFGLCCEQPDASAEALASEHALMQVSDDSELEGYVDEVLANPKLSKAVEDVRQGKDKAIGALIGQVMKRSKGQANPKKVTELIKRRLRP